MFTGGVRRPTEQRHRTERLSRERTGRERGIDHHSTTSQR